MEGNQTFQVVFILQMSLRMKFYHLSSLFPSPPGEFHAFSVHVELLSYTVTQSENRNIFLSRPIFKFKIEN